MSELYDKLHSLLKETDVCFKNTEQEFEFCDKYCTGHGCPIWESKAKKIEQICIQDKIDLLELCIKDTENTNAKFRLKLTVQIDNLRLQQI